MIEQPTVANPADSTPPPITPTPTSGARVNPDVPWPGLASYAEADRAYFHGRTRETAEMLRLVQRDPFVLLTGAAGAGKTSLLLAGLFPALRAADFLPVRVRLDATDGAGDGPLSAQILSYLVYAARAEGIDGGRINDGDTLWEAFHRSGQRWWSPRQQVVIPVLVIDQAEELFTHGRESLRRRQRTDRLLEELSQLVENRAPARVATLLETGEDKHDAFDFESVPVRVVLSIREEALAHITPLRGLFPTMGRSELRLRPFTPAQAREALARPAAGPDLLAEGAADALVRFLAEGPGAETPVHPAHLSVLGRELSLDRQRRGLPQITGELPVTSPSELLRDFYQRSCADLPAAARRFIEEDLVTPEGARTSCLQDQALSRPDITLALLETLAERRLTRFAGRPDAPRRIELITDLLCPIVVQSRTAGAMTSREEAAGRDRAAFEQSAQTLRSAAASSGRWTKILAVLAILCLASAVAGVFLTMAKEEELTEARTQIEAFRRSTQLAAPLVEPRPTVTPPEVQPAPKNVSAAKMPVQEPKAELEISASPKPPIVPLKASPEATPSLNPPAPEAVPPPATPPSSVETSETRPAIPAPPPAATPAPVPSPSPSSSVPAAASPSLPAAERPSPTPIRPIKRAEPAKKESASRSSGFTGNRPTRPSFSFSGTRGDPREEAPPPPKKQPLQREGFSALGH